MTITKDASTAHYDRQVEEGVAALVEDLSYFMPHTAVRCADTSWLAFAGPYFSAEEKPQGDAAETSVSAPSGRSLNPLVSHSSKSFAA